MTPQGWLTDDIALFGFAWTFGGVLVCVAIGFAVGARRGAGAGIGIGLLLWGAGNLATAAMVLALLHLDTVPLALAPARCEPATDSRGQPQHALSYRTTRADGSAVEVSTPAAPGPCPEDEAPRALRVRRDGLASHDPQLRAEAADDDLADAVMATWGLFGTVATLAGAVLARSERAPARVGTRPAAPAPLSARRRRLDRLGVQLGLLMMATGLIGPFVIDGSPERAVQFALRACATSVLCFLVAAIIGRRCDRGNLVGRSVTVAVLFGLAELMR